MDKVALLENQYYTWIKNDLVFSKLNDDYVSISTPFIDNSGDNINLYVRFVGNSQSRVEVSDFGSTNNNLVDTGTTFNGPKTSQKNFDQILIKFGVTNNDGNLNITSSLDGFPIAMIRLIQAIIMINNLAR